jgi:hypothetical protein
MNKKGFISMTLVISISGLLFALYTTKYIEIGQFFDQTSIKEYRLMNFYNADSCIDQAILTLTYDYHFRLNSKRELKDFNCSIDRVFEENGHIRIVATGNYKGINVEKTIGIILSDDRVEVIK